MSSLDDHDLNALSSSSSMALMSEHYNNHHHDHHLIHPSNSNNYDEMLFISQLKEYSLPDLSHHDHILHRPAKQQKTNTTSTTTTDHHHHHNISSNLQQTIDVINIPSPNHNYHVANSASAARCSMKRPKEEEMMNFPKSHDIMVSHGSSSVCSQNYVFNPATTTTATLEANKRSTAAATTTATNARLTQAQDHIMAERKRREKLSQRFIQLSALVPGLKKVLQFNLFSFYISIMLFECEYDFKKCYL